MVSSRTLTLTALILLPVLAYLGLGAWALWQTGLFAWTFWILPVFWLLTWIVATLWKKPQGDQMAVDLPQPRHFTPRDQEAMQIVKHYQQQISTLTSQQLTDPEFYLQQSLSLSRDLARFYHPQASDPISSLTVPEVLAAARLAIDDMERWMLDSVPGSRLVTIRQWKWLQHAPKWVKRIQNATWAASVLVNPANVLKYFTSEATLGPVSQELQAELLATVYLRFVRQVGFYLVEMNSGRLRGGADLYRKTFGTAEQQNWTAGAAPLAQRLAPDSLSVAIIGQVKAGKSSLVNALIRQKAARTDVLPETQTVSRYRLNVPESEVTFTLLDTPGYADAGATRQQMAEVKQAARESDMVLLVLAAHTPARAADRQALDELKRWYAEHRELRPAPVIICLTHIDLLSPSMEWKPPYNWRVPTTRKEESIHDAVEHVQSLFSDVTSHVIPVCTSAERGSTESVLTELFPALLDVLSEGQIAALLKTYHRELNQGRFQLFLQQLQSSGKLLLKTWLEERLDSLLPDRNETPPGQSASH
jgi:small GTP-binding protein